MWVKQKVEYLQHYSQNFRPKRDFIVFLPLPSVQFSRSVVSDSLRPHGLQYSRPSCPSPTPWVYPNSCPRGLEELDTTERLHFHFSLSCIGGGNGNPFQCSCLENPRDGGAWWATIYGVTQSWTWLKRLSSSSSSMSIESVKPSNRLILCHPLLPPSIFLSIRVFSNEPALCIRWPKYWSFSFSLSPSNECLDWSPSEWTGWISLQSKGLSRVFSNTTVQ